MTPEKLLVLITCSGLSNTGKCTTRAAVMLRQRCPEMIDHHIAASGADPITVPDGLDAGSLRVIVIDGCDDYCGRDKAEQCGFIPDCHVVATACGVIKSGMDEPDFSDIEVVCHAAEREILR